MSRPGARHIPSHAAYAQTQHQTCLELEELLQSADNSTAANKVRVPLCEALSDLILTDPHFACQQQVPERLWRHCFYSRIRLLRAAVHQQAKKQKTGRSSNRAQAALLEFLAEAIGLYDYLLQKLQARLVQKVKGTQEDGRDSVTANNTEADDGSTNAATKDGIEDQEISMGVVDCMHRLSVQLGDLYRYSENLKKAQDYYQRAAYLGPGHGHAMNQLAVVLSTTTSSDSQKDASEVAASQRAVALYWYVRSLSVVTTPFATARANLVRLWENNRAWLRQHDGDVPSSSDKSQSAQNRRFMSHFCELHDMFFHGITLHRIAQDAVHVKMESCRREFASLLQNSCLGDSLLSKMVTIQAFSECFLDRSIVSAQRDSSNIDYKSALTGPVDAKEVTQVTALVARTLTLWFGTELAERLLTSSASNNNKKKASLRLLQPLLLLTEYVYNSPLPPSKALHKPESEIALSGLYERHDEAVSVFWKLIIDLLNQLRKVPVEDESLLTKEGATRVAQSLNEYQNLRGFAPFQFLPKIPGDGVLVEEEALEILERKGNLRLSKSQESSLVSNSHSTAALSTTFGEGAADQNLMKVARLLWLGGQLAADSKSQVGMRVTFDELDGTFAFDLLEEDNEGGTLDDGTLSDSSVCAMSQEIPLPTVPPPSLVYQQGAGGAPLLVLGDLLNEPQQQPSPSKLLLPVARVASPLQYRADSVTAPGEASSKPPVETEPVVATQAPKPILPPPGFGIQPIHAPGLGMHPPAAFPSLGGPFSQPTVMESVYLFGGLETANPFAASTQPPSRSPSFPSLSALPQTNQYDFFADDEAMGMDGIPLLDSGLLNSLFMGDSSKTSKNPFAT